MMNKLLIRRVKLSNPSNSTSLTSIRNLSLLNIQTIDSVTNKFNYNIPRLNHKICNITKRYNSTSPSDSSNDNMNNISSTTVSEQVSSNDFSSNVINIPGIENVIDVTSNIDKVATTVDIVSPEKVNFIIEGVMHGLDQIHVLCGIPYWEAIVLGTIGIRLLMFPVALRTIQGSSRMAAMRPEMQKVQDLLLNKRDKNDPKFQKQYENEMKALFKKYKVNPLHSVLWPLSQFPVFIALFMALRDMGKYYPDFATGGAFWFVNLSVADPYLIWPLFNSLSFLAMVELGSDGIQVQQQATFKWAMRGLALVIVPLTMSMPQGLFVYWGTNNTLSIIQTIVMKNDSVRKYFDIPKPPAVEDTPIFKPVNPFSILTKALEQERSKSENAKAEILDGISATPPGPPKAAPPVSFTLPPRKNKSLSSDKVKK